MHLPLKSGFYISDLASADKPALLEHLKVKQIYDNTLAIPYPYTKASADAWIRRVARETRKQGRSLKWAIRRPDGLLIGALGFLGLELGKTHKAEIGYWLAKPYWNQGIMTEAVRQVIAFAFVNLGLVRVTATIFHFNAASARTAEKAGMQLEGVLRKSYQKDGKIFDAKLYAAIKPD